MVQDPCFFQPRQKTFLYAEIVYSPADVSCTGVRSVGPPGILYILRMQITKRVDESRVNNIGESLPFFIRESGTVMVVCRPRKINLLVRNVKVAAEDDRLLFFQAFHVIKKLLVPAYTVRQACKFMLCIRVYTVMR